MSDQYSALKNQYDDTWKELHKANEEIDTLRAELGASREAIRYLETGMSEGTPEARKRISAAIDAARGEGEE